MSDDAPSADAPSADGPDETPPPNRLLGNRGRLARVIALAGVIAVVLATRSLVVPHIPEARDVDLQLPSSGDVIGVDVRWSALETGEDITTTSLHFSEGAAPSSIHTTVRLPAGTYNVAIDVVRASHVDSVRRSITLSDASHITIPLQ